MSLIVNTVGESLAAKRTQRTAALKRAVNPLM